MGKDTIWMIGLCKRIDGVWTDTIKRQFGAFIKRSDAVAHMESLYDYFFERYFDEGADQMAGYYVIPVQVHKSEE